MRFHLFFILLVFLPCTLIGGNTPFHLHSNQKQITFSVKNIYPFNLSDVVVEIVTAPKWIAFENNEVSAGTIAKYNQKDVQFTCKLLENTIGENGVIEVVCKDQNSNVFDYQEIEIQTVENPKSTAFIDVYPNPANPEATIRYQLNSPSNIMLEIYNVLGQRIRTLSNNYQPAGIGHVKWNGKNERGDVVSSGIYFVRMTISGSEHEQTVQTTTRLLIQK